MLARLAAHGRARFAKRRIKRVVQRLLRLLTRGWSAAILEALRSRGRRVPAIVDSMRLLGGWTPRPPAVPLRAGSRQQAAMLGQLRLARGEVKIT